MVTFYCDGSQHVRKGVIGLGILSHTFEEHVTLDLTAENRDNYELEAVIHTINIALMRGVTNIRIVNDDTFLVNTLNSLSRGKRIKSKGLLKRSRFCVLLGLVIKHDIILASPKTAEDKMFIKRCHHLSRRYLEEEVMDGIPV